MKLLSLKYIKNAIIMNPRPRDQEVSTRPLCCNHWLLFKFKYIGFENVEAAVDSNSNVFKKSSPRFLKCIEKIPLWKTFQHKISFWLQWRKRNPRFENFFDWERRRDSLIKSRDQRPEQLPSRRTLAVSWTDFACSEYLVKAVWFKSHIAAIFNLLFPVAAAVAQLIKRPELRFLKKVQLNQREFNSWSRHWS